MLGFINTYHCQDNTRATFSMLPCPILGIDLQPNPRAQVYILSLLSRAILVLKLTGLGRLQARKIVRFLIESCGPIPMPWLLQEGMNITGSAAFPSILFLYPEAQDFVLNHSITSPHP